MITIACGGGIGDALRNLSLVPHETLYRRLGLRCDVVFIQIQIMEGDVARPGTGLAHAGCPPASFFRALVERCPSLRWQGEINRVNSGLMMNRALRELIKFFRGGRPRYFPFSPQLSEGELALLPHRENGPLIGIQTHLSGMRTKQWGAENWKDFLARLVAAVPNARVVLFDSDPAVEKLASVDAISTTRGFDIAQSIRLVSQLDLMISVDSWAKYIAAAHRVRQIVIVPDQRTEYPEFGPDYFLQKSFMGLTGDPSINLMGLELNPPALTLPCMAELSAAVLLESALTSLKARRKALYPAADPT